MFVIVVLNTELTPGLDDYVAPNVVGPYETEAEAEQAAREMFRDLDAFDDFSTVRTYEIRPVRTRETTYDRVQSELQMWARVYNRPFNPDYFPERIW